MKLTDTSLMSTCPRKREGESANLHLFYDSTDFVKKFYNDLKIDIIEIGLIFILMAVYPIILMLHKNLLEKIKALSQINLEI